jgi:PadR family transcriptional regulator, regulatory protein PadR
MARFISRCNGSKTKMDQCQMGSQRNNRKARFYSLTAKGRLQLADKTNEWQRLTRAMGLILNGGASNEEV